MTQEEFDGLKIDDIVYYYNPISVHKISTMTASFHKERITTVTLDGMKSFNLGFSVKIMSHNKHMFELSKNKILYNKIKHIKTEINNAYKSNNNLVADLRWVYRDLIKQKNLQSMIEEYPEILI